MTKFDNSNEIREITDSNLSSTRGRNKGYMQPTSTSALKDRTLTPQQQQEMLQSRSQERRPKNGEYEQKDGATQNLKSLALPEESVRQTNPEFGSESAYDEAVYNYGHNTQRYGEGA